MIDGVLHFCKAKKALEVCREECQAISEKLASAEEKIEVEKACGVEKSLELEQLKNDIKLLDDNRRVTEDVSFSNHIYVCVCVSYMQ